MTKESIISKTIQVLERLPKEKVAEVADFADYILKKFEDQSIIEGIRTMAEKSDTFSFLNDEENLYDESDIIDKFK